MKCPKCGFNSFEYYDSCKKCSNDLAGFKKTYFISSVVLPQEIKVRKADEYNQSVHADEQARETVESHDDIFSFDVGDSSHGTQTFETEATFAGVETFQDVSHSGAIKQSGDFFADLLESTSHAEDTFSESTKISDSHAEAKVQSESTITGEFDLTSFSWDDETSSATALGATNVSDDFDSLFGDTKDTPKK